MYQSLLQFTSTKLFSHVLATASCTEKKFVNAYVAIKPKKFALKGCRLGRINVCSELASSYQTATTGTRNRQLCASDRKWCPRSVYKSEPRFRRWAWFTSVGHTRNFMVLPNPNLHDLECWSETEVRSTATEVFHQNTHAAHHTQLERHVKKKHGMNLQIIRVIFPVQVLSPLRITFEPEKGHIFGSCGVTWNLTRPRQNQYPNLVNEAISQ